jgi:hypothetical protein
MTNKNLILFISFLTGKKIVVNVGEKIKITKIQKLIQNVK